MADTRPTDKADFEQIREFIWQEDPLGVADDRQLIPDEYDDLTWKMLRALRQSADDAEIAAEWNRQLSMLLGDVPSNQSSSPFLTALYSTKSPSSFAARLRASVE